jgi:hypothetical protein
MGDAMKSGMVEADGDRRRSISHQALAGRHPKRPKKEHLAWEMLGLSTGGLLVQVLTGPFVSVVASCPESSGP